MNSEVKNWKTDLEKVCESLKDSKTIDLIKMKELKSQIEKIYNFLVTSSEDLEIESLRAEQLKFRNYITDTFEKSYFFRRATNWPRGYPGDFETLENVYHGIFVGDDGIGMYLDNYFLTGELARGIRERKRVLGNLLVSELDKREEEQQILNIACGPSREIFDIGKKINNYNAKITFFDSDQDALEYSKLLLFNEGINIENHEFMKFNALKLTSEEYAKSIFGKKDIIYSAGLFDYIKTDVLEKMIESLFNLLETNGVLIAPFKDKNNYTLYNYHWLLDWSYFLQRTVEEVEGILEEATKSKVEIIKTESSAINFFVMRKK